MVRIKKRYFVVELQLASEARSGRPIADPKTPLAISDGLLAEIIRRLVLDFHGDHGLAAISHGFRTVYCNPLTRLVIVSVRHGPHRLVASVLPFITKVKDTVVVPRLIYTGATVRHCYKVSTV